MPAAVGVDIGGTKTKGGMVLASGEVVLHAERPTDTSAGTKSIIAVIEDLLARSGDLDVTVAGIGIGAAGFVDFAAGSVMFSPNLVYDDPHLRDAVEARTGLPVAVDNDANAAVWGERTFGSARGHDHVVLVTIGTGIGSGVITQGRLLRGSTGAAGELGHTVVEVNGPPCPCGLRGCLEQFVSGTAIARMGREAADRTPDTTMILFAGSADAIEARDVARAAREYDEAARDVLRRAGRALAIGLSNAANIFDPQTIVLSGNVVAAGEPLLGPARDELARMTSAQRRAPVRLEVSALGADVGVVGAAALVLSPVHAA